MRQVLVFLCLLIAGCSDFHIGYVPGGNPPPPIVVHDTLIDTTIVAADSVIQRVHHAHVDTVLDSTFLIHAGNRVELRFSASAVASMDSLQFNGISVATGPLSFAVSQGNGGTHPLDSIEHVTAGVTERYLTTLKASPAESYVLRWINSGDSDITVSAQILAGYSSTDSSAVATTTATLKELRSVVQRSGDSLTPNTTIWEKIPVIAGDSLQGAIHMATGLQASLLGSAMMTDLWNTGSATGAQWQSTQADELIKLAVASTDTLYYVVRNQGNSSAHFSDTLLLSRPVMPGVLP